MRTHSQIAAKSSRRRLGVGLLAGIFVAAVLALLTTRPSTEEPSRQEPRPPRLPVATADGAVTAALEYLGALRWTVLVDDVRRRRAIEQRAIPEAARELDAQLASPAEGLRAAVVERPVVARTTAIGYRVERFTASAAVVSIWGMALFGTGAYRPATQWSTSRISLVWRQGRWLVSAVQSRGGPAPDFPLRALLRADRRFREFRHVP